MLLQRMPQKFIDGIVSGGYKTIEFDENPLIYSKIISGE